MNLIRSTRKLKREINLKVLPWKFRNRLPEVEQFINEINYRKSENNPVIIFLSGLSWNRQLTQRPHHLAEALADQGAKVLFLEPEIQTEEESITMVAPNLFLCNAPVQFFQGIHNPWVYILSWSISTYHLLDEPLLIYDIVDDLTAFDGDPQEIHENHINRLQEAKLVLVSAKQLLRLTEGFSEKTFLCPNAVDFDFFHSLEHTVFPEPLSIIDEDTNPIIGYCGALAHWVDFELLEQVAILRPNYRFVLIGPDIHQTLDKSNILKLSNIHWLGQKPYETMPAYMNSFDVAMIPFKLNPITHATSPLKLFEYFAAGKPVVITPMKESMQYPGVLVAKKAESFAKKIDEALLKAKDPEYLNLIIETAMENTWHFRANHILKLINQSTI